MQQLEILHLVVTVLEERDIPYMLVGSIASGAFGEPRLTLDIDIVIDLKSGQIADLCNAFPSPEFYVSQSAAREAVRLRRSFNVIHTLTSNKIDFMIARADAWGREQLARRERIVVMPGQEGYAARPEDIIIGKLLYYEEGGSDKHLRDIASILSVIPDEIDLDYVAHWTTELGVSEAWKTVLDRTSE